MDLTAFGPYAVNVRTNTSSYGPRARLIRAYYGIRSNQIRENSFILWDFISGFKGCSQSNFPRTVANQTLQKLKNPADVSRLRSHAHSCLEDVSKTGAVTRAAEVSFC